MCGIAGLVFTDSQPAEIAYNQISQMLGQIAHRGPNGCHVVLSDGDAFSHMSANTPAISNSFSQTPNVQAVIGHCRLAVTGKESKEQQPHHSNRNTCITFNGEIYNFRQLVNLPPTASDSEAIIPLWNQYGLRFFEQLDGAWAMALLNNNAKRLILCRDRTGVKPLYFCITSTGLAFASEEQALWKFSKPVANLHLPTIDAFLRYNQLRNQTYGFISGIQEVPASHYVEIDLNTFKQTTVRYFIPKIVTDTIDSKKELTTLLTEKIRCSIQNRIPDSVNWGVCLSGGVDSGTIAALASQESSNFTAFTASVADKNCDEAADAAMVAQQFGLRHEVVQCTSSDMIAQLPVIIRHQATPIINPGTYLQWNVYARAKQMGITVMLNGQGGDELFAGYAQSMALHLANQLKKGQLKYSAQELFHFKNWPITSLQAVKQIVQYTVTNNVPLPEHLFSLCFEGYLHDLLRWDDRCAMAHGIESRTPFADDYQLMNFALSIPDNYKIRNGFGKWILRESMKPCLPPSIVWKRRKLGLATPHQWFIEQKEYLKQILHDKSTSRLPFTHLLTMPNEKWWKNPDTKTAALVFKLVTLIMWHEQYRSHISDTH